MSKKLTDTEKQSIINSLIDEIVWSPNWEFGEIQAIYGPRAKEMREFYEKSNHWKIEAIMKLRGGSDVKFGDQTQRIRNS